jgi:hypothetical protein
MDRHPGGRKSTIDLFDRNIALLTAAPGASWRAAAKTASRMLQVPVEAP